VYKDIQSFCKLLPLSLLHDKSKTDESKIALHSDLPLNTIPESELKLEFQYKSHSSATGCKGLTVCSMILALQDLYSRVSKLFSNQ